MQDGVWSLKHFIQLSWKQTGFVLRVWLLTLRITFRVCTLGDQTQVFVIDLDLIFVKLVLEYVQISIVSFEFGLLDYELEVLDEIEVPVALGFLDILTQSLLINGRIHTQEYLFQVIAVV